MSPPQLRPPLAPPLHGWQAAAIGAGLVAAVLAVYGQAVGFSFLTYDDRSHLTESPILHAPPAVGLWHVWSRPHLAVYAPLTHTWWIGLSRLPVGTPAADDAGQSGGLNPAVFHAGNVALHAAIVCLVFRLLFSLVGSRKAAAAGALLFAWHPLAVESVAWAAEAKGLLAGLFSLLALCAYVQFARRDAGDVGDRPGMPTAGGCRRRRWVYLTATVCYLLALLAKPSAVALVAQAAILDLGWFGRRLPQVVRALGPWLIPAGLVAAITRGQPADAWAGTAAAPAARLSVALDAAGFYFAKLIWPWPLGPDYGRNPLEVLGAGWWRGWWWTTLVVIGLLASLPGRRQWLVAAGLFAAAPLPVLGLVPFYFQEYSTVADRYVYLGLLGPALAVAWLLVRWPSHRLGLAVAVVLAVCGALSLWQARAWHDDVALARQALTVQPRSLLGSTLRATKAEESGRRDEALRWRIRATRDHPKLPLPWLALGAAQLDAGQYVDACQSLERAAALHPGGRRAPLGLVYARVQAGRYDAALAQLQVLVEASPGAADLDPLWPQLVDAARRRGAGEFLKQIEPLYRRWEADRNPPRPED